MQDALFIIYSKFFAELTCSEVEHAYNYLASCLEQN